MADNRRPVYDLRYVTCRLIAKNRDQLRNPTQATLGNPSMGYLYLFIESGELKFSQLRDLKLQSGPKIGAIDS